MEFRLAPMSRVILLLTLALMAVPIVFGVQAIVTSHWFAAPAVFVAGLYLWIWVRFRPTKFVVNPEGVDVIWPLKRRTIPGRSIAAAHVIDKKEMRSKIGWGMRVGAGGLWGGFGWLWTTRQGIVQMYISRLDEFVWIEITDDRPWLITPERPGIFVRALNDALGGSRRADRPDASPMSYNVDP
jgi:hypothetical protein